MQISWRIIKEDSIKTVQQKEKEIDIYDAARSEKQGGYGIISNRAPEYQLL